MFTSNGCGMAGAPMKGYEFLSDCCDLHDAVCIRISLCIGSCHVTQSKCSVTAFVV